MSLFRTISTIDFPVFEGYRHFCTSVLQESHKRLGLGEWSGMGQNPRFRTKTKRTRPFFLWKGRPLHQDKKRIMRHIHQMARDRNGPSGLHGDRRPRRMVRYRYNESTWRKKPKKTALLRVLSGLSLIKPLNTVRLPITDELPHWSHFFPGVVQHVFHQPENGRWIISN